ncbi:hypothetical protein ACIP88_28955 [Streptomyces uncialis]|uniref:hypothetical protein n=1 Tax=Streptomyces uncialis TaxID=1048205 RepID=UPI00382A8E09
MILTSGSLGPGPSVAAPRGRRLYLRSRRLTGSVVALVVTAALTAWADRVAGAGDPSVRVSLLTAAPLAAAAVIGTSLYTHSEELDRTAARHWWPRRLTHLVVLSLTAAVLLGCAVLGTGAEHGVQAMVRNTLGATGTAALAAVVIGARLSWLPPMVQLMAAYMAALTGVAGGGWVTPLGWPAQPGDRAGAWSAALTLFIAGAGLHAWRGAGRPDA